MQPVVFCREISKNQQSQAKRFFEICRENTTASTEALTEI